MARDRIYNNYYSEEAWNQVNKENKDLLADFLLELKQNKRSPGTIEQYRYDLKGFFCYVYKTLDNKSILDLTKKEIRGYSIYLQEDCGVSNARHNRMMSSIRSLLTHCENDDELEYDNNVARKVIGLGKEPVKEIYFLLDEDIIALKDELVKRKEYQKATLLMLAYDSAGRKNELTQVEKHSFYDPKLNCTNKVIGKRRKTFRLIYFNGTKECAKLWLEQRGTDNVNGMWLNKSGHAASSDDIYEWFISMRIIFKEVTGKDIDFNVHTFRHTALENYSDGTHYVCKSIGKEDGFPLEKLKLIANHSDVSTTSGYLKDKSLDELENMFGIKIE